MVYKVGIIWTLENVYMNYMFRTDIMRRDVQIKPIQTWHEINNVKCILRTIRKF